MPVLLSLSFWDSVNEGWFNCMEDIEAIFCVTAIQDNIIASKHAGLKDMQAYLKMPIPSFIKEILKMY